MNAALKLGAIKGCLLPACVMLMSASYTQAQTSNQFYQLLEQLPHSAFSSEERIQHISKAFLGAPYVDGNLGEGEEGRFDRDPLYRFDVFDCTTYVEMVLAGAISTSKSEFVSHIKDIRYLDGKVSFVTRNHFASADWLINNQGILRDVTLDVAGEATMQAVTSINKPAWYQAMGVERLQGLPAEIDQAERLSQLHAAGSQLKVEQVSTPYVPLTALFNEQGSVNQTLLDRIPSGAIISIVRPNYDVTKWIGTHLNITHQALALRINGVLYLRHASQTQREVVDQDFVEYFSHYLDGSTVKGFNVQQPRF